MGKQTILMCRPQYFAVDYVINPWMQSGLGSVDSVRAALQWDHLCDAISDHAEIVLIDPQPGFPDLVYTANAGMVFEDKVIISRFRSAERRGEEKFFERWFRDYGLNVTLLPEQIYFEGAGDALLDRAQPLIWAGYGFRSDTSSHPLLEQIFQRETISLRLSDPRFYHLDTCLCPLPGGFMLYYPAAFDADSLAKIHARVAPEKRIAVDESDALQFCCNAVELDGNIFVNGASEKLRGDLFRAGFNIIVTPLSEFLKGGGTAKCLTLKLIECDNLGAAAAPVKVA
ncbi:MAG: nitrate reductase [Alphaproteobacteria bacterium]|nr:MAG: nitrate reductase [Alphaproteobacteria bacterium]